MTITSSKSDSEPLLDENPGSLLSGNQQMTALIDQARADVNLAKSACDDTADATGQIINSLFENMPCWGDDANNV